MNLGKRLLIFGLTTILGLSVLVTSASAQNNPPGSGLSISPLHNQLTLDPGQSSKLQISLKNITTNTVLAKAYVNDFKSDNNTGNPVIVTDQKQQLPTSIKKFVKTEDMQLAVGEKRQITIPVDIPAGTTPGAYYGIVRYRAIPAGSAAPSEGEVSLSASVGTIVLIQVKGDLKERAQLSSLKVYSGERSGTFFLNKPNKAGVEISNLGNSFVQPFGKVTVNYMSGKEVYSYEVNNTNPRSTVLPDSKRTFLDPIKNIDKPGRYTVNASIALEDGSNVLVSQKTIWYITGWLLAVILAAIAALAAVTYFAYRRYHKSKRRNKKSRR